MKEQRGNCAICKTVYLADIKAQRDLSVEFLNLDIVNLTNILMRFRAFHGLSWLHKVISCLTSNIFRTVRELGSVVLFSKWIIINFKYVGTIIRSSTEILFPWVDFREIFRMLSRTFFSQRTLQKVNSELKMVSDLDDYYR